MNTEILVREIASKYIEQKIGGSHTIMGRIGHKDFINSLKSELTHLYEPETKMLYLDQVMKEVSRLKAEHNERCEMGEDCETYKEYEIALFFIKQEIDALPKIIVQNLNIDSKQERKTVFISYSHLDKDWLSQLKRHFKPFENRIDFWDDSKIDPGKKWKEEIELAISKTKVAVLLLSADFFNSNFILNNELPPLLAAAEKEGATILSVILKPCLFDEYPEISSFQAINAPSFPIIQMDEYKRELTWVELVKQIKNII